MAQIIDQFVNKDLHILTIKKSYQLDHIIRIYSGITIGRVFNEGAFMHKDSRS